MSTFTAFKLKNKVVPFAEYAEKRSNYEFLKEFNTLNNQSACVTLVNEYGDELNVNRGFLGLEDMEDLDEDTQKYSYLADQKFDQDVDFSNPASLLLRQKKMLQKIEEKQ